MRWMTPVHYLAGRSLGMWGLICLSAMSALACQAGIREQPSLHEQASFALAATSASSDSTSSAAQEPQENKAYSASSSPSVASVAELDLFDPVHLQAIQRQEPRLRLGLLAFGSTSENTHAWQAAADYRTVVASIAAALAKIQADDAKAGTTMRFSHRLFDRDWLISSSTFFDLVGIVNRLDRYPFDRNHCGETRLIYRLAYRQTVAGQTLTSRLPMTINLVFWQEKGPGESTCVAVATRWMRASTSAADVGWWVRDDGPLGSSHLQRARLKALELNVQTVRWPSVTHPSLGGHAQYLLRVFLPGQSGLQPGPLENTPDVSRLARHSPRWSELLRWLQDPAQTQALRMGTLVVPSQFLAVQAASATPRGLARLANRPFSQIFSVNDFLPQSGQSVPAMNASETLRRLDALSCQGCHESRSVAGFHVLGADDPTQAVDALALPVSPHYLADRPRRLAVVEQIARAQAPSESRMHAELVDRLAEYGEHCGWPGGDFATASCASPWQCAKLDDEQLGVCLPEKAANQVGDPCEVGPLSTHAEGARDRMHHVRATGCGDTMICNGNAVGFPLGMCTATCEAKDPQVTCGAIVALQPFNSCLARHEPFTHCLTSTSHPAGLRACSAQHPCRDDYVCARIGAADPAHDAHGVCMPPYFLFQLRVDGHGPPS